MTQADLNRQWPWARIELGLTRSEFDRLTLREFNALRHYWVEKRKDAIRQQAHHLYIVATAGHLTASNGQALTVDDFLPAWLKPRRARISVKTQFLRSLQSIGAEVTRPSNVR